MYGLVRVLEDACPVDLLFVDKQQAENFVRFIETYIAESGAGNGYGAYWHSSSNPVIGVDTKTGIGNLRLGLVKEMSLSICDARKARPTAWQGGDVTEPEYMPQTGVTDGVITFHFDASALPPRIQPGAGDLVRIVDNPSYSREIARVKEVMDESAVLTQCQYSGIEGEITLPLDNLMKIHDFLNGE